MWAGATWLVGLLPAGGSWMGLALRLAGTRADGGTCSIDVLGLDHPSNLRGIAGLGPTLSEAKQLLARVQQAVAAPQARGHAPLRPECSSCGARCHVEDWQSRQVATLFGAVARAGTDVATLVRRAPDTLGRTSDTELTTFTDGCLSLRAVLAAAGISSPPVSGWLHPSARLQHAKQAAEALPADCARPAAGEGRDRRRG